MQIWGEKWVRAARQIASRRSNQLCRQINFEFRTNTIWEEGGNGQVTEQIQIALRRLWIWACWLMWKDIKTWRGIKKFELPAAASCDDGHWSGVGGSSLTWRDEVLVRVYTYTQSRTVNWLVATIMPSISQPRHQPSPPAFYRRQRPFCPTWHRDSTSVPPPPPLQQWPRSSSGLGIKN